MLAPPNHLNNPSPKTVVTCSFAELLVNTHESTVVHAAFALCVRTSENRWDEVRAGRSAICRSDAVCRKHQRERVARTRQRGADDLNLGVAHLYNERFGMVAVLRYDGTSMTQG